MIQDFSNCKLNGCGTLQNDDPKSIHRARSVNEMGCFRVFSIFEISRLQTENQEICPGKVKLANDSDWSIFDWKLK